MLIRVLIAALVLVGLAALVAVASVLRDPRAARRRIEGLFTRPAKPPRPLEADHYYRPYWS